MTPPVATAQRSLVDQFPIPVPTETAQRSRFRLTGMLVWTLTIIGATIRVRGLTSGGLRTSDAWVGLTAKVGLGQAWHMLANAPGFYFLERAWLQLHPGVTWWGQLPALAMGIASIPAIYLLFGYFRFERWIGLTAAFVVAVSPICIIYSTRDKEYSLDFLLTCLLLVAGEEVRRHWRGRDVRNAAIVTLICFVLSGSTLPIIAATWLALAVHGRRTGHPLRVLMVPALPTAAVALAFDRVFYSHLSPYLNRSWSNNFISHASPRAFVDTTGRILVSLYQGMTGSVLNGTVVCVLLTIFVILGARRGAASLSSTLVVGAALVACAAHTIPLGTGRSDEVLYPAILILIGYGLQDVARRFITSTPDKQWHRWVAGAAGIATLSVLFIGGATTPNHYDTKEIQPIETQVSQQLRPGDHIVVDAMLRYTWALYEDAPPRILLGDNWMTGFSVASTHSNTFIVPSFAGEGDWRPGAWTRELAHYRRLWIMEPAYTTHPSLQPPPDTYYLDLTHAGWHATRSIAGTGVMAILLQH